MLTLNTGVTYSRANECTPGYILFAPVGGNNVYLINYEGSVVHQWRVGNGFTFWCYLLPNGNLFVNERSEDRKGVALTGSGLMREYDWFGNLVWEHHDPYQHHDARKLEGGGACYLAFAEMDKDAQSRVVGGVAGSETEPGIFGELIREVDEKGELVWEWDLSELGFDRFFLHRNANRWSHGHTNTIQPLADDKYLISSKSLNLIFIVDRNRNKVTWHFQSDEMGGQHDAQMLENGNILLFANGAYASDLHNSQVWEVNPVTNEVVWIYKAKDNPQGFFSPHIGGCQRLESGNTLVCEGAKGCIFETTPGGKVVWEYVCPYLVDVPEFGNINWLFRARHYSAGSSEIQNRV